MSKEPKMPFEGFGCFSTVIGLSLLGGVIVFILISMGISGETASKVTFGFIIIIAISLSIASIVNTIKGKGIFYNTCPHCKSRMNPDATVCSQCGKEIS